MKKWLEFIQVSVFFIGVVVLLTFPAVFHLSDQLLGDGGDNLQFFGWMKIVFDNVAAGKWLFADTDWWRYPVGFEFSRSVDGYLLYTLGLLLHVIVNPVLAYNLSVVSLYLMSAGCAYVLFRHLGRSKVLGVVGAVAYAFSFLQLARNGGHPNLVFTGGLPLFVYALLRLRESQHTKRYLGLMGLAVLLTGLGSLQYLLILVGALPFALFLGIVLYPDSVRDYWRIAIGNWQVLLGWTALFSGVFLVYAHKFVVALWQGTFVAGHGSFENLIYWSPNLINYVWPNDYLQLWYSSAWSSGAKSQIDFALFLGFIEIALFIWFLLQKEWGRLRWLILGLVGWFFVLSLGVYSPDLGLVLPYAWLVKVLPYWGVAEAPRWYIVFYLFVTMGVVLSLRRVKRKVGIGILVLGLLLIERFSPQFYLTSLTFFEQPFVQIVRQLPGKAVLDIPVDFTWATLGNTYDLLAFDYRKKIVNGYIHWSADTKTSRKFLHDSTLYRFMCDNENKKYFLDRDVRLGLAEGRNKLLIDSLRSAASSTVVLHKQPESHLYFAECTRMLAEVTRLLPRVVLVDETDKVEMMELRRFYNERLNYSLYFPRGGAFTLQEAHYTHPEGVNFSLRVNDQEVEVNPWVHHSQFEWGRWTRRSKPAEGSWTTVVPSGAVITFSADAWIEKEGFMNLWYSFDADELQREVQMGSRFGSLELKYFDSNTEVWQVL